MNQTRTVEDLDSLILAGDRFGTVYADPPWLYGNQATRSSTSKHYAGMTVDELCALPVSKLAADDAHLHLWTTNGFLFETKAIMEAWGFEYKSCLIWVKPQLGIGNYWRVSHEFLLFGLRGNCPFRDHSMKSWVEKERGKHSAKPEIIRRMIEKASTGPFLELFGRRVATGWTVWGNQIVRTMFDAAVERI
jgi:N6-adenosine-specific RNA methylase IME4